MNKKNKTSSIGIQNILIYILVLFVPFRLVLSEMINNNIKYVSDIIIALTCVICLINKRKNIKIILPDYIFAGFILFGFFSTLLINKLSILNFLFQTRSFALYYFLFIILRQKGKDDKFYNNIRILVISVFYALFFLTLFEKIFDKNLLFPVEWSKSLSSVNKSRTYSLLNNPNVWGSYSILVLVFNYYFFINKKIKYPILISITVFCAILLSGSLSATIFFFIILFGTLLLIFNDKERKIDSRSFIINIFISLTVGMAMYFGISFATDLFQNKMPRFNDDISSSILFSSKEISNGSVPMLSSSSSLNNNSGANGNFISRIVNVFTNKYIKNSLSNGRLYSLIKGFVVYKDYWLFGSGFGTFGSSSSLIISDQSELYEKYDIIKNFYSDNQYISVLVETGIIGFSIFVTFIICLVILFKRDKFKMLVIIGFSIIAILYNVYEMQVLTIMLWLMLSISITEKT